MFRPVSTKQLHRLNPSTSKANIFVKPVFRLQAYRTSSLKSYFDQDALLFPVETIVEKTEKKDFSFFLDHGNFFKVVDTLEKFEQGMVNTQSKEGKEFTLFKRQLYQMYEVRHRSVWEHEQFSLNVERRNLKMLYDANMDFISEMGRVDMFENMADHTSLKGKVFKMKTLSPNRLRGLASFGAAFWTYSNLTAISLMVGPTLPMVAIAGTAIYGMRSFSEREVVSQIESIDNGQLRLTILKSPLVSYTITTHVKNVQSVCALGDDDMGADDVEGNIISISSFTDASGEHHANGVFRLPADAFRDKQYMEWILAPKSSQETTADDFSDLMKEKFAHRVSSNNMNLIGAFHARQTAFANVNLDKDVDYGIEQNHQQTHENIKRLTEVYGKDKLNEMEPAEFYKLYKHHTTGSSV